jgi:hypothetical protein
LFVASLSIGFMVRHRQQSVCPDVVQETTGGNGMVARDVSSLLDNGVYG